MFKTQVFQLRRKSDNSLTLSDAEAAEELTRFFECAFVKESFESVPVFSVESDSNAAATSIDYIETKPAEVYKKLLI